MLVPGRVVRFRYLWRREAAQGHEIGAKVRPCIVFLTEPTDVPGQVRARVVPISHSAPTNPGDAFQLPPDTRRRLGLDEGDAWVSVVEFNRFVYPGGFEDLPPTPDGRASYGPLPQRQFARLFNTLRENARRGDLSLTDRDG